MDEQNVARLRDWVEPAHPTVVKLHDDLYGIYTQIRDRLQESIDGVFDRVSRQFGFVVTTTLPVTLEFGSGGALKSAVMGAEHLKGTAWEKELTGVLRDRQAEWKAAPGTYRIYVIWRDALKLKLRADWMEPAHWRQISFDPVITQRAAERKITPGPREPAHWFDPGIALEAEEAVLISVIDEVYPELRLVDRIAYSRELLRVKPDVMEPAHFHAGARTLGWEDFVGMLHQMRGLR